jgi:NAD(P)-dependent dehydrogenase (short-subunit alcohol dehydrogenase family)
MKLQNRTAIVTGAASGIGRAIAIRFAAEGARVIIADVRESPLEGGVSTCDEIGNNGGDVQFYHTDVTSWDDLDNVVCAVARQFGRLDIMVNNAAIYTGTRLTETSEQDWDRVMAVNAKGVFLGCKSAVRQMLKQEIISEARGRIVNISSQHGMISCPGDIAYGVSKSAVVYMTRQVAADYAADYIICNAVAPGKILTGRTDAVSDEAMAYSSSRTPMPRLGRPSDVASAVLFLASDECTYITGENLMVDGGWMSA